jgi:hypothetical protein
MLNLTTKKKLCPHLQEPFDDCYCVKMSSQDIERAVYLCSMNFEICDIYKNDCNKRTLGRKGHKQGSITC